MFYCASLIHFLTKTKKTQAHNILYMSCTCARKSPKRPNKALFGISPPN